jgi:replicative DNA helicase
MSAIDKRTKAIVTDIGKYFELHSEHTKIDFPVFRSLFFTSWHKNLKEADVTYYNTVLKSMEKDESDEAKKNLVNQLIELEFATVVANTIEDYRTGEDIDIVNEIKQRLTRVESLLERSTQFEFASFTAIEEDGGTTSDGYKWPLPVISEHYRDILAGDMFIIAARPGKGKTTFLCQLNAAMAATMPKNKVIVWFNNESRRQRIMSRQIQSALRVTNAELRLMKEQGVLEQQYINAMGSLDRVRVYDIHGKNHVYLMEILESIGIDNVGAVICDMLDNVKFPLQDGAREDQRLEQMYQWFREMGVYYSCPMFATSQISNEGAGLMFPSENMLKDSKTGKQGACDGILMIGTSDDPLRAQYRGLSFPKEKHKLEGKEHMRAEVVFDSDRGVYL